MFKRLGQKPWICSRCLLRQQRSTLRFLRPQSTVAATQEKLDYYPTTHGNSDPVKDDEALRQIFDSPGFWKQFSSRSATSHRNVGLLQNKWLTSPEGFEAFTNDALERCQRIVNKVLKIHIKEDYKGLAKDLDRLSDQLCRVIDLVDFIRNVHPDARVQDAATRAHMRMFEYMNVLNTTKGLEDQLQKAYNMLEVYVSWSEEERVTSKILLKDFAQSATGGPEESRQKFVQVSNEILQIGTEFLDNLAPAEIVRRYSSKKLNGMDPVAVRDMTRWGSTMIPTHSPMARLAMKTVADSEVRKDLYIASRTASRASIALVEQLVKKRAELAQLSGHESFAHMTLADKMAQTPEAVNQFLEALAVNNKPYVQSDLAEMLALKQADGNVADEPNTIHAWDRSYYADRLRRSIFANTRQANTLSEYFSLGTVMQGLSRLFNRLYGIRLVPNETAPGETWNDDVRRLDVVDEDEGHIAVLYCDLFQRPNKSPNPAHFTLRCSREIHPSEISEASASLSASSPLADLSSAVNDGMSLNRHPTNNSLHQLPTIAFICDFPRSPSPSTQPTLLTFEQLSTLFHEMGHALHSILGRTRLQNVAGTRCATDFAELPSVLMEHFAASPAVLALYARHWQTDAPLDPSLLADALARRKRLLAAHETETQVLFSVLDQAYHSPAVPSGDASWNSTAVFHAVHSDPRFAAVAEPAGTAWQGFFGHLVGYGAVYYSYLFDRAIAARVWRDVFEPAPVERARGQRYRDEVLRWGGARDGWACVAGVLGQGKGWMREGGEEAMQEVGRWGAGEAGEAGAPF